MNLRRVQLTYEAEFVFALKALVLYDRSQATDPLVLLRMKLFRPILGSICTFLLQPVAIVLNRRLGNSGCDCFVLQPVIVNTRYPAVWINQTSDAKTDRIPVFPTGLAVCSPLVRVAFKTGRASYKESARSMLGNTGSSKLIAAAWPRN
jgi:hypothetical protein